MNEALAFAAPDVAVRLEQLPPEALDRLPFGVIRLAEDDTVTFYSKREAELSGYGSRPSVGHDFFEEIAPCLAEAGLREHIEAAQESEDVDFEIGHTGDYGDPTRFFRIRVLSARGGGYWLLTLRDHV